MCKGITNTYDGTCYECYEDQIYVYIYIYIYIYIFIYIYIESYYVELNQ